MGYVLCVILPTCSRGGVCWGDCDPGAYMAKKRVMNKGGDVIASNCYQWRDELGTESDYSILCMEEHSGTWPAYGECYSGFSPL